MAKYHSLAIYHARVALSSAVDQSNLAIETNRIANPAFAGSELEKVFIDLGELALALIEVIDKWEARGVKYEQEGPRPSLTWNGIEFKYTYE